MLTPVAAQAGRLALLVTLADAASVPHGDGTRSTTTAQAGGSARQARPVDQAPFQELVQMYRAGRHKEAVSPTTLWSAERLTLEIGRVIAEEAAAKKVEEREVLTRALRYFPDDPELQTALGSVIETVASLRTYALPPGSPEAMTRNSGGCSSERGGYGGLLPDATLGEAEVHYAQALLLDPKLDEARLRLAHVRLLKGRTEDALRDLGRVATEARQPRQRYLARLFAGYARQRLGDLDGAVAAYRAALAHGPRAQTALLALGRSLDQLGDTAGAQEALAGATALDAPLDPWWSYGAGQPERLDELVAELRGLVK